MASLTTRLIFSHLSFAVVMTSFLAFSGPAQAQEVSVTAEERAKIESVIRDYLDKNPGLVMDSLQKHQQNQRADLDRQFSDKFATEKDAILKAGHPTIGPANADVTIFEFYDYNCGYCKKAYSDVSQLLEEDKKLRFVFIEMPILSETSIEAAKWALAADKQGKFFEFHSALMKFTGTKDKKTLEKIAGDVKMDLKKAAIDSESKQTMETLEGNLKLARDLGVQGTPGFIIGNQLTPGYMGYEGMKEAIASARGDKTPVEPQKK